MNALLEQMLQQFSLKSPAASVPLLQKHMGDVTAEVYKGTKLVPGWMVVSSHQLEADRRYMGAS